MSCDLAVAADDITFARSVQPRFGGAGGATQFLHDRWRPAGTGILLLNERFPQPGVRWGLVNQVVPRKADATVNRLCEKLYHKLPERPATKQQSTSGVTWRGT
jgi:enoyl-CoA hydratase/carnithine racemase